MISRYKSFIYVGVIFLAVKIYLLFSSSDSNFLTPDSYKYIELANKLNSGYVNRKTGLLEQSLQILPGYPLFIKTLFINTYVILLSQITLHVLIAILATTLASQLSPNLGGRTKLLVFILIQLETSLFIYSLRILSELMFSFLLILLVKKTNLSLKSTSLKNQLLLYLIIILVCITRPVGFYMCVIFIISILVLEKKRLFIKMLFAAFFFILTYSMYNFLSSGTFTYTTLQNHYLLFYEGAGAKAYANSIPLSEAQAQESILREVEIGKVVPVNKLNNYNFNRGMDLILENRSAFIKVHLIGISKVLFGPNRSEILQLINGIETIKMSSRISNFIVFCAIFITGIISLLGLIGMLIFFKHSSEFKFISIIIVIFVIGSSGPQAYGRFRAPISSFLVVFAALSINWLWLRYKSRK